MPSSLPHLRHAPLAAGLLIAVASLCSCAQDGPGVDRRATARTITTAAERAWDTGEYELVARFDVPEDPDAWNVRAARREVVRAPDSPSGARALRLADDAHRSLDIPLPADLGEFNRVTATLVMKANGSARATLLRDGAVVCEVSRTIVLGLRSPQALSVDIPGARMLRRRPDTLRLTFFGGTRRVQCWDFAVWRRPWESWAAELSAPERRPVLGAVSRPGAVVASDNERGAHLDVPAADAGSLGFYYGNAPRLSHPLRSATLTVRLTSPSRAASFEYDLRRGADVVDEWTAARIDLAPWAGERVDVEFALRSEADGQDFCVVSPLTVHLSRAAPRTVLFVTSDTHRADHVAAIAGSVDVRTPTFDALGARGVIFDDCYSTTNVTIPSHVALLTATPPRDTMVLDNVSAVAEAARTLAESFHENGFATVASVSAAQLQHRWSGLGQGFDAMAAPERGIHDGGETIAALKRLVDEHHDRDLFVWLHLFDAHRPYDRKNRFLPEYWPEGRDPFDPSLPQPDFPVETLNRSLAELRDAEYMNASYKSEVTYVDHLLGEVLAAPRFDDAIIAVTADHGECLGEYDVWWNHAGLYPENLRVPLLLCGPGVPAGRRVTGPVQHLGIGRTLLDLAGLEHVAFPGESLLVHLDAEPDPDTPRFALCVRGTVASLELGDWFCALNLSAWIIEGQPTGKAPHSVELYDLGPDGDPLRDVAQQEVERASRMRGLILDWLDAQRPTGWLESDQEIDAAQVREVAALGYAAQVTDSGSLRVPPDCDCEYCALYGRD